MTLIAIDIGTSFIKGCVLDLQARRLEHALRFPFPEPLSGGPARHEYDPLRIVAIIRDLIEQLAARAGACEGVVMCGQMHGLVLCDPRGAPLSNLTTWQDERALQRPPGGDASYFELAARRLGPQAIRQLGNEFRAGLPVARLFSLAEQGQLPAGAIPASLPDFVVATLCGTLPTTDATNGMAHGALDLHTLSWHGEALAALGLDGLRWPEVLPQGARVGELRAGRRSIPCYVPVGDYQCALVGALVRPGELSLNISTGSQVSLLAPRLVLGDFQTRPFFDGQYLGTITHNPAGRSLNMLIKLLTELAEMQGVALADPWAGIERAAEAVAPPRLRVDLAFFASSCGDEGAITHMREAELTVGHLFRAAFQNMAENYVRCAERLRPIGAWDGLVFSGGLAHKLPLLRRIAAEALQREYRLCPEQEDTLFGLLVLGLAYTGRAASVQAAMAGLGT